MAKIHLRIKHTHWREMA